MIEAALSVEGCGKFPAVICYEGIYYRDHWEELTDIPWWYSQSPQLEHQIAWRSCLLPGIGQDWMELPVCYGSYERDNLLILEQGEQVLLSDKTSGKYQQLTKPVLGGWESFTDYSASHPAESIDEINFFLPYPEAFDLERFKSEGQTDLAEWQLKAFPDLFPFRHVSSPLWSCYSLWGYENLMRLVADCPDLVAYACDRNLETSRLQVQAAAALGARGIWIEECLTDQISPQAYRALNLPFLCQLVETIRSAGLASILYFCGNPIGKLDLLLQSRADALSFEESKKGFRIDITEIAEAVNGRCTLLGNLDVINLLPDVSEAELRQEIQRQFTAGRSNRNRFIMSLGSPVTPGTSPSRVRLYCDMVHSENEHWS
jgi:hypothetical protein